MYKILTVFFLLLVVVFLVFTYLPSSTGTYNSTMSQWEWQLNTGWNEVTFTQEQISACSSDDTEDVFESIDSGTTDHDCILNYVFEDETWYNYWFCDDSDPDGSRGGGTLQHILPDTIYHVKVSQDCVLAIGEDVPPDITISSNIAVTAVGVIGIIGFLASGTRYLMLVKH